MFQEVESKRIYKQIVAQIRSLIKESKLKPGEKLPSERELSQKLKASRASIREALSALEILGLIECRSGQGNFVAPDAREKVGDQTLIKQLFREHSPYEIYEARLELEPSIAALAAKRRTPKDLEMLEKCLAKMSEYSGDITANLDQYMEEDGFFHLLIAQASHNEVMRTMVTSINRATKEKHWKALKTKSILMPQRIEKYADEHQWIFNAITEQDSERARREVRVHITEIEKDLFGNNEF